MNFRRFKAGALGACFLSCAILAHCFLGHAAPEAGSTLPRVIIISLSGVRNAESMSDPSHQYMPHLWDNMRKYGRLYTNVLCDDQQFHIPTFNAINTGRRFPLWYNVWTPTLFQYAQKQYKWPSKKLWMIGHWQNEGVSYKGKEYEGIHADTISLLMEMPPELEEKLSPQEKALVQLLREGNKKFTGFSFAVWDSYEELFFKLFKKVITLFHPRLVHYVMGGPETAHYDSFARYALALKRNDEMLYEIWNMIRTDPYYKDNTYLIISPDTSRDDYYRMHNNNAHDNPAKTWLYMFGPYIEKGQVVEKPISHVDIFSTAARMMHVDVPPGDGKPLF